MSPEEVNSPSLNATGIKRVQAIVGVVLFYGREVDKKLLLSLNAIGTQQATANESTNEAINHLLDYLATYHNDGIIYRSITMVLAAHSYLGLHNESKGRSWAWYHIFLAKYKPVPRWNVPILTISQVIKHFMSSAAESELGAIFIIAKKLVPMWQNLIDVCWPHPPTSIQTDNSMTAGVVNDTIIALKTKSVDLRLHWLRCRKAQKRFRFYWSPGSNSWAD